MSCQQIRSAFLDHDWSRAMLQEAVEVVEHLKQCRSCREATGEYEELRRLLLSPEGDSPIFGAKIGTVPGCITEQSPAPPVCQSRSRRTTRWAGGAVLAVSLVIGVVGWALYFRAGPRQGGGAGSIVTVAQQAVPAVRWTQAEADRDAEVFANVSETFGGRTSWVAIGDRSTELGLMASPAADGKRLLVLQLVVLCDNQEKSRTDLAILPGQSAVLRVPFENGKTLHYTIGTTAGRQPRLSLWAELRPDGGDGEALAVAATQLTPVTGQTVGAGRLVTSSGSFNLEVSSCERDLRQAKL